MSYRTTVTISAAITIILGLLYYVWIWGVFYVA